MRPERDGAAAAAITRRTLVQRALSLGVSASTLGALEMLARVPERAAAARTALPEAQFDIEGHLPPAVSIEGVKVRFGPTYTTFATLALTRTPTSADQATLAAALAKIEAAYPFSPSGLFTTIAYGMPYFERLPGGMGGALVSAHMPRLAAEPSSYAFEEAVPGPTDVSPANPEVRKLRFDVPVQIESNDMVLALRSDIAANIEEALAWLLGEGTTLAGAQAASSGLGGLLSATSRRLMFVQQGLPRRLAEEHALPYAETINPASPMWMGFISQQLGSSGPAPIVTFLGNGSAKLTTARSRDYFDHGSVMRLSHLIQDLAQFYERPGETYVRRTADMFGADPVPRRGYTDQFTNGGGPVSIPNLPVAPEAAEREAEGAASFDGQPHLGHTTALQRTSRAHDHTPMHIRADGPGFDSLDVPDGSQQPKLHFSVFVPTAQFFRTMRRSQASLDLAQRYGVPSQNQGIERFLTATRRQNFLVPPRRNRAFPLLELA